MKILVVCQYYHPEPFRITDICETLIKEGHSVTVLTGLPNYPEGRVLNEYRWWKRRQEVINGVNIIRTFEIGRGSSKVMLFFNYLSYMISASFKALTFPKFDIVFVNQLSPVLMAVPAILYKKIKKVPIALYCLDLWPDSIVVGGLSINSKLYRIFLEISKFIYRSVDKICVTSSMFEEYFKEILKIQTPVKYIPQYAEDLFLKEPQVVNKSNNDFNLLFAGNIGDAQSVETIVLAANELKENKDIKWHIVGSGSALERCKQLSCKLQLDNCLTFYGRKPIEKMHEFYALADVMLVTMVKNKSLSYTLPGKVQTYMAAGKAIIAAADGETARIIEKSKCGYCNTAEDYKGLAISVLRLRNSNTIEELSNNAKIYYNKYFSKKKVIKELINFMSS